MVFLKFNKSKFIAQLINDIDSNYQDWNIDKHRAENTKQGIKIWIGNGWGMTTIEEPCRIFLTMYSKYRISRAIQRCTMKKILKTMLDFEFRKNGQ